MERRTQWIFSCLMRILIAFSIASADVAGIECPPQDSDGDGVIDPIDYGYLEQLRDEMQSSVRDVEKLIHGSQKSDVEAERTIPLDTETAGRSEDKETQTPLTIESKRHVDPEVYAAQKRYQLGLFEYQRNSLRHRENVIATTNTLGYAIFAVIHALLLVAILVAVSEYSHARKHRLAAESIEGQTELKLSLEGISLKTSLHGTLLMAFSAAFYFLYLVYVYPITILE